jgi:hypothetical protein
VLAVPAAAVLQVAVTRVLGPIVRSWSGVLSDASAA